MRYVWYHSHFADEEMEATVAPFPLPHLTIHSPLLEATFPQLGWDVWLPPSFGGPLGQDVLLGKEKRKAEVK